MDGRDGRPRRMHGIPGKAKALNMKIEFSAEHRCEQRTRGLEIWTGEWSDVDWKFIPY
jgi:hypothetical protein